MTAVPTLTGSARSFAAATAIAAAATGSVLALVVLWGPSGRWGVWLQVAVPFDLPAALAAVALVALAWPARRTSEGLAYALLVLACQWAPAAELAASLLGVGGPVGVPWATQAAMLASDLCLYAASAAILTLFAAAPDRRLGAWVGPTCWAFVLLSGLGAVVSAAAPGQVVSDPGLASPGSGLGPSVAALLWGWARNDIVLLVPLALGVAGSLRAAGRRHLAAGRRGSRRPPLATGSDRLFWAAAVAALAAGWTGVLYPLGPTGGVPALAWLAAGVVAVRWSRFAGWAAIAVSLAWSAGPALGSATIDGIASADGLHPWGTAWAQPGWWAALALGWVLMTAAAAAAWRAFAETRPPYPGPRWRAAAVAATALAPALAVAAAGSLGPTLLALYWQHGEWSGPLAVLWTPVVVFLPLGAGLVVLSHRRLVPAVAEAELVAGRPLAPARYASVLAAEFVTGQAQARALSAEAERARLASDLHAEVLPSIAQALAESEAGAAPDRIAERLRKVDREVRGLLAERRLVVLEEFGIVEALEWLVDRTEERVSFPVDLTVDDRSTDARPPLAVEQAAFRIAQLAVENAIQHARPSRLALDVLATSGELRVEVADDGRGWSEAESARGARANHLGLADMVFQASQVRGHVDVGSPPAGGTTVAFAWTA
jgi:signal transduction histidine kinase